MVLGSAHFNVPVVYFFIKLCHSTGQHQTTTRTTEKKSGLIQGSAHKLNFLIREFQSPSNLRSTITWSRDMEISTASRHMKNYYTQPRGLKSEDGKRKTKVTQIEMSIDPT